MCIGDIEIHGQLGAGQFIHIAGTELRRVQGRELCSEIVAWVRGDKVLARRRLVCVPHSVDLRLREVSAGRIALSVNGLKTGWRLRFGAGKYEVESESQNGHAELNLYTPGKSPGIVRLRLSEPATGRALELQASWPARSGMIVDPFGVRLERNEPISVEALQGWRALVPEGMSGDLLLQLTGSRAVSLPIAGEVAVASHMPSIQAMLAQGGSDAQVNLSLVVAGQEGPRLEIRRYHDDAIIKDGRLLMGLKRDDPVQFETGIAVHLRGKRHAILRAVNLSDAERVGPIETSASVDLSKHLQQARGAWLVQCKLDSRVQRTVVWHPQSFGEYSRQQRVDEFAERWLELLDASQNPDWDRLWQLMSAVGGGW